jgi:SAM-dependent methyltransferase
VGVDSRLDRIRFGKEAFTAAIRGQASTLLPGAPAGRPRVSADWIVGDIAALPIGNEQFDCIVCHFAVNFADNPVITLRELYRLLRPNGRLIVASFTPYTDLAAVYRARLCETQHDGLVGMHRDMLLDLAQLHESIRCRRLHPFTSRSLVALLGQITAQAVRTFPSLDNQVLVATVQKPDSARWI